MAPIMTIFPRRPRHHTTQALRLHNFRKLPRNQRRRIPRPEHVVLPVVIIFTSRFFVRDAVRHGGFECGGGGDAGTVSVVEEAVGSTVL